MSTQQLDIARAKLFLFKEMVVTSSSISRGGRLRCPIHLVLIGIAF